MAKVFHTIVAANHGFPIPIKLFEHDGKRYISVGQNGKLKLDNFTSITKDNVLYHLTNGARWSGNAIPYLKLDLTQEQGDIVRNFFA